MDPGSGICSLLKDGPTVGHTHKQKYLFFFKKSDNCLTNTWGMGALEITCNKDLNCCRQFKWH